MAEVHSASVIRVELFFTFPHRPPSTLFGLFITTRPYGRSRSVPFEYYNFAQILAGTGIIQSLELLACGLEVRGSWLDSRQEQEISLLSKMSMSAVGPPSHLVSGYLPGVKLVSDVR
jgi:hypothetical protein